MMKAKLLPLLWAAGMVLTGPALAADSHVATETSVAAYNATVDPDAFHPAVLEDVKKGVTADPATVRLIAPGMDKFSIYPLIGPPHFGEGVTRRWNYVLYFPLLAGESERRRCRMQVRFESMRGQYHVFVSDVVWQEQACADRVAAAG
jgi:outer membrane protein assembly factor BamE (lipoprotein component of BamABCDE complex)